MTEQNPPEMDPAATFRMDQQAAEAEHAERDAVMWAHQVRDADTTLDQREAVTRRVAAQASLLTTLDSLVWLAVVAACAGGVALCVARMVEAFR